MNKVVWVLGLLSLMFTACAPAAQLKGADLGGAAAPDFHLTDQTGQSVSLANLSGKVVVLTFLYTHCPDECPLTAEKLHVASEQLGDSMKDVAYLAVSVDPIGDTPEAVRNFVHLHRLDGQLQYLSGTRDQLAPVWTAYYIAAQDSPATTASGTILHSTRVIVIDKTGHQRVNFDSDFDPADLVADVRVLVNE
jgi:protein SCO1/2